MNKLLMILAVVLVTLPALVFATEPATTLDFEFITWLTESWSQLPTPLAIVGVLWVLVPVFSLIVALTPTPRDDAWWGKYIYPALEWLSLNFLKSKQKPGDNDLLKPFDPRNYSHRQ